MEIFKEILKYEFIQNALVAAILINIVCGIIGTFIVIKKIAFISGGISHATFGGIGIGYFLGVNPIIIALPFSVLTAMLIGLISKKTKIHEDVAIGIIWAFGMAIGIIFMSLKPGYAPDLFSYLFGNILTISKTDIYIIAVLGFITILLSIIFFKEFCAVSFNEEYAYVIGVPVGFIYYLFLVLIALSIVVLIRVVGVILVIALLTIPASISKLFVFKIKNIMYLSISLGILITLAGLSVSYFLDTASGATIVIVSCCVFLISYIFKLIINKAKIKIKLR